MMQSRNPLTVVANFAFGPFRASCAPSGYPGQDFRFCAPAIVYSNTCKKAKSLSDDSQWIPSFSVNVCPLSCSPQRWLRWCILLCLLTPCVTGDAWCPYLSQEVPICPIGKPLLSCQHGCPWVGLWPDASISACIEGDSTFGLVESSGFDSCRQQNSSSLHKSPRWSALSSA